MLRPLVLALTLGVLVAPAHADRDWTVRRDPFDPAVIARYKAILTRDPHDARALARLVELYRRHRRVDLLVTEYRSALLGDPEAWPVLVVLAHLHRVAGDDAVALASFERAVAAEERDVASWIAIGKLSSKREVARGAYATALHHARNPRQRAAILRALVEASRGDVDAVDRYFARLLELSPRDGRLWIERGDALAAGGKHAAAAQTFVTAEGLFATDPVRRVAAIQRRAHSLGRSGDPDTAILELERALAMAPHLAADLAPRLLELLDQAGRKEEALARHEALARAAPGDVAIVLSLARRQGPDGGGLETLERLSKRAANNIAARSRIAEHYQQWNRVDLADLEYRRILAIITRLRDATTLAELAKLMLDNGSFELARDAYSAAIKLTPKNPELLSGRSAAAQGLEDWWQALRDVEDALALIGTTVADRPARRAARLLLIQIVMRATSEPDSVSANELGWGYVHGWETRFGEDPPDVEAGYFLAAYYARSPRADQPLETLRYLHALVPDDEVVAAELVQAKKAAEAAEKPTMMTGEIEDPFPEEPYDRIPGVIDAFVRPVAAGVRLGVGTGVYGDVDSTLSLGVTAAQRVARRASLVWRLDWAQRQGEMGSAHAMATSVGFAIRTLTTAKVAVLLGAAQRAEMRFGHQLARTTWGKTGLAGDLTADLVIRNAPFIIGVRLEQWYSGHATTFVELAWGARR
jgi:tetratricopeptide (TPR) repeat protein